MDTDSLEVERPSQVVHPSEGEQPSEVEPMEEEQPSVSAKTCVFDLDDTCLDLLSQLGPVLRALFNRPAAYQEYSLQLRDMMVVLTATGSYRDVQLLGPVALEQMSANEGVDGFVKEIPESSWELVKLGLATARAHQDVAAGLDQLKAQGWRLVAYGNATRALLVSQLTNAGIAKKFDAILSIDSVRAFKPAPVTYRFALKQEGLKPEEAVFVSCHDWDVEGAKMVGMKTAFVQRHLGFGRVFQPPDFEASDFVDLANKLGKVAQ